ncbi:MAG: rhomboid family intramembrane serine protease [Candidatus Eisenbacteria bacterium]
MVRTALVAVNIAVFIYEFSLGSRVGSLISDYGVIPASFYGSEYTVDLAFRPHTLLTSLFLHGGWFHVGGNMLYLWIFGDNVEDRMGHVRFLLFYLLCGVAASLAHVVADPRSPVPTIGASGAIAGVLGAYFFLYPRARVVTIIPLGFFLQALELPAFFFLGFWFLIQFVSGAASLGARGQAAGGVAWWAHIGGFVAGALLLQLFRLWELAGRRGRAPRRR